MSMRVICAGFVCTTLMLVLPGRSLGQKPAALPLDLHGKCANTAAEADCLTLDAMGPAVWAALVQAAQAEQSPPRGCPNAACEAHWLAQARHLYLIAEQCRQSGDLAMARSCYQEVQLLAPKSPYAKKSVEQLQELTCDHQTSNAQRWSFSEKWRLGGWGCSSGATEEQETLSPADWWRERFLKAAREIREERLRRRDAGEEQETPETKKQSPAQRILEGTVPLEIYLQDVRAPESRGLQLFSGESRAYMDKHAKNHQIRSIGTWRNRVTEPQRNRTGFDVLVGLPSVYVEFVGAPPAWVLPEEVISCFPAAPTIHPIDPCGPYERAGACRRSEAALRQLWEDERSSTSGDPQPLSKRLHDAARRLLDSLDIELDTDGDQGVRMAINLGGQHYLFHYTVGGAWMMLVLPTSAAR